MFQSRAIPHVLEGKNCLIAAETGCGKTLAYLAPIIQQILHLKRTSKELDTINAPIGLIITPGRDLAEQIYVSFTFFAILKGLALILNGSFIEWVIFKEDHIKYH